MLTDYSISTIVRCSQDIYYELDLDDQSSTLEDIYSALESLTPEDLLGLNSSLLPLLLLFNVSNILLRR